MKHTITILITIMFIFTGCDKKTTDSNNKDNNVQSYTSQNIKETTVYFSFSTNQGSTNANSDYDIMFYSIQWQPDPLAPIISDPRFAVMNGLSVAVIDAAKLDDVTEVPSSANFLDNFASESGEWYDETPAHLLVPKDHVYIVNTTDGKFPAFEITSYYAQVGDEVVSGYFNIDWKYLSE